MEETSLGLLSSRDLEVLILFFLLYSSSVQSKQHETFRWDMRSERDDSRGGLRISWMCGEPL